MALKTIVRHHLSSAPLRIPVAATFSGVIFDPTGMAVAMAFPTNDQDPSVWTNGTWDTAGTIYKAQCVPPSMAVGNYDIYLRLTGTYIPIIKVGYLQLV